MGSGGQAIHCCRPPGRRHRPLLGTVILPPGAEIWQWWFGGVAVHLLVGALWASFYAYFFWALLPLRPAAQGLLFSFIPIPLAIFAMRPQLELMNPLVQEGLLPFSGLFGLDAGWAAPLSVAAGHLVWGATLGAVYTRPVGNRVGQPPTLPRASGMCSQPAVPSLGLRSNFCSQPASSAVTRHWKAAAGGWI